MVVGTISLPGIKNKYVLSLGVSMHCQCEHIQHNFHQCTGKITKLVNTTYGKYWLCTNCEKKHLQDYIIK